MDGYFAYFLVAGATSTLLLLMIHLTLNCLHKRSHRHQSLFEPNADTQPLIGKKVALESEASHSVTTSTFQHSTATDIKAAHGDLSSDKATITHLTLKDILNKTYDARHKWENIGIQLGLEDDLEAIRQTNYGKTDNCYREMLTIWLRKKGATWEALAAALNHKSVGYCGLADSLIPNSQAECSDGHTTTTTLTRESSIQTEVGFKCRYCGNCSLEQYMKRECPELNKMIPDSSSFPYLDTKCLTRGQADTLYRQLQDETENMIKAFGRLVLCMQKSVKEQNIDPMEVTNAALLISYHKTSMSLPDEEFKSIYSLVRYLVENNHISFFNYHIVEYIITEFGRNADKRVLNEYETKFKEFCRRSVFKIPQDALGSTPRNEEKLAFKITDMFAKEISLKPIPGGENSPEYPNNSPTLSLRDAQMIRDKIAKVLCLENRWRLNYLGASPGCVELTFSAPKNIIDDMKTQLRSSAQEHSTTSVANLADLDKIGIQLLCAPPGKPNVFKTTDSSIHLQWTEPEYHGFYPIKYYLVHCKPVNNPTTKLITRQTKEEKYIIDTIDLPLKETVTFKIQAVTKIGHGAESEESDHIKLSSTRFRRQSERRLSFSLKFSSAD